MLPCWLCGGHPQLKDRNIRASIVIFYEHGVWHASDGLFSPKGVGCLPAQTESKDLTIRGLTCVFSPNVAKVLVEKFDIKPIGELSK